MIRSETVVVDAGPLYAYVDADDAHHERSADFLLHHPGLLVIPQLVIAEIAYFIARRLGTRSELLFLADVGVGHLRDRAGGSR